MPDNPLEPILNRYMEGISGNTAYRQYTALAFMLNDLKSLAYAKAIQFCDVERKAETVSEVTQRHFKVTTEILFEVKQDHE